MSLPNGVLTNVHIKGVLLLCDVALGDSYQVKKPEYVEKLPDGKLSTIALSKFVPDPTKEETV